jgi:hypothetical protein
MADVKISALPAASTPLDGTELVPIVQGGVTEQVTVANLTAGRTVAASTVNVDANTASNAVRVTQTGSGNALLVEDSANPDSTPFVVNNIGSVGIGLLAPETTLHLNGQFTLDRENTTATTQSQQINQRRKRQSDAILVSGDRISSIFSSGWDGASYIIATAIFGEVDGTPGASDMPGRLVFSTTADGASSLTERMRITAAGNVGIGTSAPVNRLQINGSFGRGAPVTKTNNFTLADTENWIICNGAGSITVTFPAASSWTGREVMIKTIAAQTVVSASSNVVPLAGGAAGTAILAASAGAWATLVSDGTNWIIMQA